MQNQLFLNTFLMKTFSRMRNKAQMFSSLADDHYHTRLLHSLEVDAIAKRVALLLMEKPNKKDVDVEKVSQIALLHDIGHTPFGHVGERTLHNICSGKKRIKGLPNFKKLEINCGFKHNINSGLLYIEYLIKTFKSTDAFSEYDAEVIDGIVKHTKVFYNEDEKLYYPMDYLNSSLPFKIDGDRNARTLEGRIVAFSDEIAQVVSDFKDLSFSKADITKIRKCAAFAVADSEDVSIAGSKVAEHLILLLVNQLKKSSDYDDVMSSKFGDELKEFDIVRSKIIKTDSAISAHDHVKERTIEVLYKYYFDNFLDREQNAEDYLARIKRQYVSSSIKNEIDVLNQNDIKKYFKKRIVKIVKTKNKNPYSLSNKEIKSYTKLYRLYVLSVAMYISKMTDGYANHKLEKIIAKKYA